MAKFIRCQNTWIRVEDIRIIRLEELPDDNWEICLNDSADFMSYGSYSDKKTAEFDFEELGTRLNSI